MARRLIRAADLAAPQPDTGWWFTSINLDRFDSDARQQIVQQVAFGHRIRQAPRPDNSHAVTWAATAMATILGLAVFFFLMMYLVALGSNTPGSAQTYLGSAGLCAVGTGIALLIYRRGTPRTPSGRIAQQIVYEVDLDSHLAQRHRRQWTPVDHSAYNVFRELSALPDWQRLHDQGTITDDEWAAMIAQAYALRANVAAALTLPSAPTTAARTATVDQCVADLNAQLARYRTLSDRISEAARLRAAVTPPALPAEPEGILSAPTYDDQTTWEAPAWQPNTSQGSRHNTTPASPGEPHGNP